MKILDMPGMRPGGEVHESKGWKYHGILICSIQYWFSKSTKMEGNKNNFLSALCQASGLWMRPPTLKTWGGWAHNHLLRNAAGALGGRGGSREQSRCWTQSCPSLVEAGVNSRATSSCPDLMLVWNTLQRHPSSKNADMQLFLHLK